MSPRYRDKVRRRLRRIIHKLQINIDAAEWWATNRPEERPIDCECDRVALAIAKRGWKAFKARDNHGLSAILSEMEVYLSSLCPSLFA